MKKKTTFKCKGCDEQITVPEERGGPPVDDLCDDCRRMPVFTFVHPDTKQEYQIRAFDAELATLKAWKISRKLQMKLTWEFLELPSYRTRARTIRKALDVALPHYSKTPEGIAIFADACEALGGLIAELQKKERW